MFRHGGPSVEDLLAERRSERDREKEVASSP
jgi:hypothetical protein